MTTDYKVTELFCIIDEFCKHFDAENAGNLLEDNSGVKRRRRAASLSDSEIMTILLYFHFGTFLKGTFPIKKYHIILFSLSFSCCLFLISLDTLSFPIISFSVFHPVCTIPWQELR